MYIYKGFISDKKGNEKYHNIYVNSENEQDMNKCFDNIRIPFDIYSKLIPGTPVILILEYKDSSCPIALSVDGINYIKSKNNNKKAKSFRGLKNEFHNIIDTKKNKLKILKSFLIPFYSNLIAYPYYIIILGFYALFFSFFYTSNELSNMEFLTYSLLSTYISSLFLIALNIFIVKKMYNNGKQWITKKISFLD